MTTKRLKAYLKIPLKEQVLVYLDCEVYTNQGELITRIETAHRKEYQVQVYGFCSCLAFNFEREPVSP